MKLFVLRPNPHVKYPSGLPGELYVYAHDEQQARNCAHAFCPRATSQQLLAGVACVETRIVGVTAYRPHPYATWDRPYQHQHLTSCEAVDDGPPLVLQVHESDLGYCSEDDDE